MDVDSEHRRIELQNDVRQQFQDDLSPVLGGRYFTDIDYRPGQEDILLRVRPLHFVTWSETADGLEFVDDVLTESAIVVETPQFDSTTNGGSWLRRIVGFNGRIEPSDVNIGHRDVFQWERYRTDDDQTGRLKIGDESILEEEIRPIPGMRRGIESLLKHQLDDHVGRSERSGIPLEFVERATPNDWERVAEIRPPNP